MLTVTKTLNQLRTIKNPTGNNDIVTDGIIQNVTVDADKVSFDIHTKNGVRPKPLKPGTFPTIPLSALIPKGSENIIVAGRSVSSDRLANSGLRVQAPCMAMGQAAACTAVLAAKSNTTPAKVPLADIHALLKKHKAIVPSKS